jgi:REP element-mobilizing transposase RayT
VRNGRSDVTLVTSGYVIEASILLADYLSLYFWLVSSQAVSDSKSYKGGLTRLDPSLYTGISYVHWTMCVSHKATGWLDASHHSSLKELLFHALARENLCCPAYCLMPDHGHFLFLGLDRESDQRAAVRWLRREWNRILEPKKLQYQPYDHVLRESDRARDAFAKVAGYIYRNPERAGLVDRWQDWLYVGALFPGYPKLDPRKPYYWSDFWKAHHKHLRA